MVVDSDDDINDIRISDMSDDNSDDGTRDEYVSAHVSNENIDNVYYHQPAPSDQTAHNTDNKRSTYVPVVRVLRLCDAPTVTSVMGVVRVRNGHTAATARQPGHSEPT